VIKIGKFDVHVELDIGYWILDIGCGIIDTGYGIRDMRCAICDMGYVIIYAACRTTDIRFKAKDLPAVGAWRVEDRVLRGQVQNLKM
jgi:hypothetical protein